jgi:hypothetical protein
MQANEATSVHENTVTSLPRKQEAASGATTGNYEAVRFNAMKHGVLSKLTVLPHEDRAEFDDLLAALVEEHRPSGMTERYLVEELAAIMWRKRRVLLVEGAQINRGLRTTAHSTHDSPIQAAVPFEPGLSSECADLPDLLAASPEEVAERRRDAERDLAATRKAAAILPKGAPSAYDRARRTLVTDSRDWWDERVGEEDYPATAEGLAQFIREHFCISMEKEARYQPEIRAQTLGEGLQAHRLLTLSRYQTHLDRKFERTLAMILRLKNLRRE